MGYFCTDDNYKLYFDEFGDSEKPAILFLYDLGGKRSFFAKQVEGLKADYHVILWDYRGHGAADHEHRQLNFERLAKDLEILLELLKLSDVTLAGAGAGGAVILNYVRLYGEKRIARIILMDASLKEIKTADWKYGMITDVREAIDYMKEMTYDWKNFAPKLLRNMFGEETIVQLLRKLSREESAEQEEEKKQITQQFLDNNNNLMMALMVGYITEDNRKTAKEMTVPVLVTYGKAAESSYADKEKAIASYFVNAKCEAFNGGTLHYFQDAKAFNETARSFMKEG